MHGRLNGNRIIFTEKVWDENISDLVAGTLDFDYVCTNRPIPFITTVSPSVRHSSGQNVRVV